MDSCVQGLRGAWGGSPGPQLCAEPGPSPASQVLPQVQEAFKLKIGKNKSHPTSLPQASSLCGSGGRSRRRPLSLALGP